MPENSLMAFELAARGGFGMELDVQLTPVSYTHLNPNATDEQLEEACRLSQADEFIQQFPQKYDTYIEPVSYTHLGPVHRRQREHFGNPAGL